MSNPRRDSQYLADIQEAMQRVLEYTQGLSFDAFMEQRMAQDAVLRNLQVIGEATKKLSDDLCATQPNVPWQDMAGLRDRIVHDYFGIDYEIVWDVIENDLPALLPVIEAILHEESGAQHG
jgi:uncharacterized protein with HEPN domain